MSQSKPATIRRPSVLVLICCALFVAANVAIPLTLGDVYPFTVAPMFCDAPQAYCNYRVYDPNGKLLADNSTRRIDPPGAPDPFYLRRYYDGNPTGLGVGICPPPTIDGGTFGSIHDEQHVRSHIAECLADYPAPAFVDVEQEIVGPVDKLRVGVVKINRWRIVREAK
jgi:hypothetical protein